MGKNVRKCNENGKVNFMGLCKVGVSIIEARNYRTDSVVESTFGGFQIPCNIVACFDDCFCFDYRFDNGFE